MIAAGIINAVIYFIGVAAGASMKVDTPAYTDVSVLVVAVATIIPLLLAGFVTWLIARKYRGFLTFAKWAGLIFAILTIGSLLPTAEDAATLIALSVTHVVAGVLWFIGIARSRSL
jgi:LytS/YehU family sensor histidine kinase